MAELPSYSIHNILVILNGGSVSSTIQPQAPDPQVFLQDILFHTLTLLSFNLIIILFHREELRSNLPKVTS